MSKAKPPFIEGTLVKTRNDSTFLGRSHFEAVGTSTYGQHESFQYPAGTILMVVGLEQKPTKGWKYSFMTPDRGILHSSYDSRKLWLRLMDTID